MYKHSDTYVSVKALRYICICSNFYSKRIRALKAEHPPCKAGLRSIEEGAEGSGNSRRRGYDNLPDDVHDGSQPMLAADAGRRCRWHCPRWHSWRLLPAARHAGEQPLQPHGRGVHGGRHDDGEQQPLHDDANGDVAHGDGHDDDRAAQSIATFRLIPFWPPHLNQTRASPQNPVDPQSRCH